MQVINSLHVDPSAEDVELRGHVDGMQLRYPMGRIAAVWLALDLLGKCDPGSIYTAIQMREQAIDVARQQIPEKIGA